MLPQKTQHVEILLIPRWYYVDTLKGKFRRIYRSFRRTFFDMISMGENSPSIRHTFFHVISIGEKSISFQTTFFDVISMDEKLV